MQESHSADAAHAHGPTFMTYLAIFGVLLICTAVSFIVNVIVGDDHSLKMTAMLIILAVAVCKAVLVTMYFMHVKFEWSKLYFLIIPVLILAVMMMIVLMPDGVVGWHHDEERAPPITAQQ